MFMGDSGSQFIGLMIAFFSIKFLWGINNSIEGLNFWQITLAVLICFTAPCIDTFSVVLNRIRNKKSPLIGGKDHTTHHLVYAGYSEKKVFLIFLLIGFISCILTILLLCSYQAKMFWVAILGSIWFIFIFYFLYRNTIKYKQ
jgi:UDP-GlcNAc:undecaprenyl-phosphate GlcNAc-1-phosphate transferase